MNSQYAAPDGITPLASCASGAIRCNRGATGIEIIDNRDTIDTFNPHK